MLQPKRVKYRKSHRGRRKGHATSGNTVAFGDFGLKALETEWVTARQIEAARIAINRRLRRGGKVWVRVFPDKSVTKKPAEIRQGGGKGNVDHWVAVVKPGRILFEVAGVQESMALEALRLAAHKLPVATRTVGRDPFQTAGQAQEA
ncbi:MAG: 50S ribosomal protein L16 [Dehalococcoidia bacterium]